MKVGIVVPTMGTRGTFLLACLESIRSAGTVHICLVAPSDFESSALAAAGLIDSFIEDPGLGLASAINHGIKALPKDIEFVSWLGDDDKLKPKSLGRSLACFKDKDVVGTFGRCEYIDSDDRVFWTNRTGQLATLILAFGPNRIPQPGSLFRRSTFDSIGGLDVNLGWAFDQDLFHKLIKHGKVLYVNQVTAQFRWHLDSLSAGQSGRSRLESASVRLSHAPNSLRWFVAFMNSLEALGVKIFRASLDRKTSNNV